MVEYDITQFQETLIDHNISLDSTRLKTITNVFKHPEYLYFRDRLNSLYLDHHLGKGYIYIQEKLLHYLHDNTGKSIDLIELLIRNTKISACNPMS